MIQLTCTNCKTVLNIDDAFAGGVCRCQHCGTIQTVPSHLKDGPSSGAFAQAAGMASTQKALYKNKARADAGTGLDTLADVVTSSGLSSGLTSQRLRQRPPASGLAALTAAENRLKLVLVGSGVLVAILLVVILFLLLPDGGKGPDQTGNPVAVQLPSFADIKLDVPEVIYVLDRGSGTQSVFGDLKNACYKSILSLGRDRKFQIIFWNNGSDTSYPADNSLVSATPENIEACKQAFAEVYAFGHSEVRSALEKAVAANPHAIILATGKAWDLDDEFTKTVLQIRGNSNVKIHTLSIGSAGGSSALQEIARKTGGQFREIPPANLHTLAQ